MIFTHVFLKFQVLVEKHFDRKVLIQCHVPTLHLGEGRGLTIKWNQSLGLGDSNIEYRIEKHVSSNMLA